jgi:hypothetical protein
MKKLAATALALAILPFVGCNTSPTGGAAGEEFAFTPPGSVTVKQGDEHSEKVKVEHKSYKGSVTFSVDDKTLPKHVKINFDPKEVKPDQPDTSMKIKVDDEAPEGDHKVKIVATPEKGNATTKDFTLKITKK